MNAILRLKESVLKLESKRLDVYKKCEKIKTNNLNIYEDTCNDTVSQLKGITDIIMGNEKGVVTGIEAKKLYKNMERK